MDLGPMDRVGAPGHRGLRQALEELLRPRLWHEFRAEAVLTVD